MSCLFLRIGRMGGGAILAKVEDAANSADFTPLWVRQHGGIQARNSTQDFGAGGKTKGWTNVGCIGARCGRIVASQMDAVGGEFLVGTAVRFL